MKNRTKVIGDGPCANAANVRQFCGRELRLDVGADEC